MRLVPSSIIPSGYQPRLALLSILLLAFGLRIHNLAQKPLWFDETLEFWVATAPMQELLSAVRSALQDPPLYSFLLHLWLPLGQDEFTLRLLSLFFSLTTIAGLFVLVRRLAGLQVGLIAAFFLAIMAPHIRFAQEVGQYALAVWGLTFNLLALSYARTSNRHPHWIAWLATGLICIYAYYGTLLIILPIAAFQFFESLSGRQWPMLRRQIGYGLLFGLAALPLLTNWLPDQLRRGSTINALQITPETLSHLGTLFLTRTPSLLAYQLTGLPPEQDIWRALQSVALALMLAALLSGFLLATGQKRHFLLWLALGWATYYVAGGLRSYPYNGTRHSLILLPLLIPIVSLGIYALWIRWRFIGIAILVGVTAVTLLAPPEPPEDLRTVTRQWLAKSENHPSYVYYGSVPGFRYQLQRHQYNVLPVPPTWFQDCWSGEGQAYCHEENIHYGRWLRNQSVEEKREIITEAMGPASQTFWLIYAHTDARELQELITALQGSYQIIDRIEATNAGALLLQPVDRS